MTRLSLIKSAKDLFLKYGVKSVSMDDIARMLGISKKTIYTEVSNKSELVEEAIRCFIEEEKEAISAIVDNSENALDEITGIAAFVMQALRKMKPTLSFDLKKYHPAAWAIIEHDHYMQIEMTIKNNIRRGIDEGYYRDDLDELLQSKIYVGLARLLVEDDFFNSGQYERPYLYKQLMTYHLNGILSEKGRHALNNYLNKENLA